MLLNLRELPFSPSVALQNVPRQSVGDIISQKSDDDEDDDEEEDHSDIDRRIKSKLLFSTAVCLSCCFPEVISRFYNDRVGAESGTDSDLEDTAVFDESPSSSLDGVPRHRQLTSTNGYKHDQHPPVRPKRNFFRSSLLWGPLQGEMKLSMSQKTQLD